MKKSLRLIVTGSTAYAAGVFLIRGFLPDSIQSTLVFLVAPLAIVAGLFSWDLMNRAKVPSRVNPGHPSSISMSHEVQEMSKRIEVGKRSSSDYYNKVIVNRLRDLLVEKASVETGLSVDHVRRVLATPRLGRKFLRDESLYDLLYNQRPPKSAEGRQEMLDRIINLIEAWKN